MLRLVEYGPTEEPEMPALATMPTPEADSPIFSDDQLQVIKARIREISEWEREEKRRITEKANQRIRQIRRILDADKKLKQLGRVRNSQTGAA